MTEEKSEYKIKNKFVCEICGKSSTSKICSDCTELEKYFKILKNINEKNATQWLKNKLKEI